MKLSGEVLALGLLTAACAAAAAEPVCVGAVAAGSALNVETLGSPSLETPPADGRGNPVIHAIEIRNGDVFDLDAPGQDKFVHRVMNALHMQTRPEVIEHQLLMQPGDTFSSNVADESARLLRENKFLATADIVPTDCTEDGVDLAVITADSWSLTPSVSFASRGGKTTGGFRIDESNLFGSGTELKIGYKSGIDRDSASVEFLDRHLRGSRVGLDVVYSDNSDGSLYSLGVAQPFFALETAHAGGFRVFGVDEIDNIYELGDVADEFERSA